MAAVEPKKPVGGAFGQFLSENRPKFMEACKGQAGSAVSKMAGEKWKEVSAAEKAKWQNKYDEVKAQYDKDLKAFEDAGGVKAPRKRKGEDGKRKKKDPNAPKKPAGGAFGQFLNANRAQFTKECAGLPITAISKKAGEKWKTLSDAEKKPYEETYKKAAEEYKKAMEEYKKNGGADDDEEDDEEAEDEAEQPSRKKRAGGA